MRKIDTIILHTAAYKKELTAKTIREWHMAQGWNTIGYHFVITGSPWDARARIEYGRPIDVKGAHAYGSNTTSVGICFTGHGDAQPFTEQQMYLAKILIFNIIKTIKAKNIRVIGHRETPHEIETKSKTCPGTKVDMDVIRTVLSTDIKTMQVPKVFSIFGNIDQPVVLKTGDTFTLGDGYVINS